MKSESLLKIEGREPIPAHSVLIEGKPSEGAVKLSGGRRQNGYGTKRSGAPAEIISHAVWLYHRFTLSFRDVEDLLSERGIIVSY